MKETNVLAVKSFQTSFEDEAFKDLTIRAKRYLNDKAAVDNNFCKGATPSEIEHITEMAFKDVCFPPFSANNIHLISGHVFPDIIAAHCYGVEVKSSTTGGWKSTGSSIVESTRPIDVRKIYMLFANLSGTSAQFECKPYEECLSGIAVTHSPRYMIDMNLNQTIFDKIKVPYDVFRSLSESDKISRVRAYYKEKARLDGRVEMPWWMGGSTDVNLSFYNDLLPQDKEQIKMTMFILFPELLRGDTATGYKKAALWLCNRHSLLCYNMRDTFSAGGQIRKINGVVLKKPYPKVVGEILKYRENIEALLKHPTDEILADIKEYWNFDYNLKDLYKSWVDMVVRQFKGSHIDIKTHIENGDLPE